MRESKNLCGNYLINVSIDLSGILYAAETYWCIEPHTHFASSIHYSRERTLLMWFSKKKTPNIGLFQTFADWFLSNLQTWDFSADQRISANWEVPRSFLRSVQIRWENYKVYLTCERFSKTNFVNLPCASISFLHSTFSNGVNLFCFGHHQSVHVV